MQLAARLEHIHSPRCLQELFVSSEVLDILVDVAFGDVFQEMRDTYHQAGGPASSVFDTSLLRDRHGAAAHARLVLNGLHQYTEVHYCRRLVKSGTTHALLLTEFTLLTCRSTSAQLRSSTIANHTWHFRPCFQCFCKSLLVARHAAVVKCRSRESQNDVTPPCVANCGRLPFFPQAI